MCVDWVVVDCVGYSMERKKVLKIFLFYGKVLWSTCEKNNK